MIGFSAAAAAGRTETFSAVPLYLETHVNVAMNATQINGCTVKKMRHSVLIPYPEPTTSIPSNELGDHSFATNDSLHDCIRQCEVVQNLH